MQHLGQELELLSRLPSNLNGAQISVSTKIVGGEYLSPSLAIVNLAQKFNEPPPYSDERLFDKWYVNHARQQEETLFRRDVPSITTVERRIARHRTSYTSSAHETPHWFLTTRFRSESQPDGRRVCVVVSIDISRPLRRMSILNERAIQSRFNVLKSFDDFDAVSDFDIDYVHDEKGRFIEANEKARTVFGIPLSDDSPYSIFDLFDSGHSIRVSRHVQDHFRSTATFEDNLFHVRDPSGTPLHLRVRVNRIVKGDQVRIHGRGRAFDESLGESLARYARAVKGGGLAIWDRNLRTGEFRTSKEWRKLTGVSLTGPVPFSEFKDTIHTEDRERVADAISANERGEGYNIEHRLTPEAGHVWINSRGDRHIVGDTTYVSGVTFDVTDRKREHFLLRTIADASPNFVFIKDEAGKFVFVNDALCNFYGVDAKSAIGKSDNWFYQGDERLHIRRQLHVFRLADMEAIRSADPISLYEQIIPPHGDSDSGRWLATSKRKVEIDGRPHVLGIATDITELASQKETLETLMRHSPAVMYVKGHDGRYIRVNQAFVNAVGAGSHHNVLGSTIRDHFDDSTSRTLEELDQRVLATGEPTYFDQQVLRSKKDGTTRVYRGVKIRNATVDDLGNRQVQLLGVFFDVTSEQTAMLYNKMSAILHCLDHDYANSFLSHIRGELSRCDDGKTIFENRFRWAAMLDMCAKFLGRLRWLEEAPSLTAPASAGLWCNYGPTLKQCIADVDAMMASCSITVPPVRFADAESESAADSLRIGDNQEMISTVLLNYIRNARKCTVAVGEMGEAELKDRPIYISVLRQTSAKSSLVSIGIDDFGIGLEHIVSTELINVYRPNTKFLPFGIPGTGNGLYFTREIIEKFFGGKVHPPERSKRGGALFSFDIPVEEVAIREQS